MSGKARSAAAHGGILRAPAARTTNRMLLVALLAAFATGAGAFATGSPAGRWVVVTHGVVGLAVLLLTPWKTRIIRRGMRRRRPTRWASSALAVLALATVVTGIGHSTGLVRSVAGQLTLWVHVAAALSIVPLAVWHVAGRLRRARPAGAGARRAETRQAETRRARPPEGVRVPRRLVLRAGLVGVAAAGLYAGAESVVRLADLPGSRRRFTGSYEAGSFDPATMPTTIWLDDRRPDVDPSAYRLEVSDAAGSYSMPLAELSTYDVTRRETLDCTSGWYAEQDWTGAPVAALLRDVGDGRSLLVRSVTGYWIRLPVEDAGDLLLATQVGGRPLSAGHGFPARLVAPGRRGYWWVKWVDRVEVQATPAWWQPPFPLT